MAAPWEQQPGESAKAYAAFLVYRDLGARRSVDEASRSYHQREGAEADHSRHGRRVRASGTIRRWAQRWDWQARTRAWDQETQCIRQTEQQAALKEMAERHVREAVLLQTKALERLRQLRPEELKTREILAYFVDAARLERQARGEPTEVVDDEPSLEDVQELSDDELTQILAQVRGRLLSAGSRGAKPAPNSPPQPL